MSREFPGPNDRQLERLEDVYRRYRMLHDEPDGCSPMIVVNVPSMESPSWKEMLAYPMVMLRAELDNLVPHLEIEDDRVPTVRVQFGTAQVAAAFGCSMHEYEDSPPAAGSHVLAAPDDVFSLTVPSLDAGWYGRLHDWTALWKERLPAGVHIQHADIQSAFNSAHLIRGNDIMLDLFDRPDAVEHLLDVVTDFMIAIMRRMKAAISDDREWFFDWGAMWKGGARISNCSMQMISPEFYLRYVLPRDIRFFEAIGGGRVHYCGITGEVIDEFFRVPSITGLDVDCTIHDFHDLCSGAPKRVVIMPTGAFGRDSATLKRLLAGDWPTKRNIIVPVQAAGVEEGRSLLQALRASMPW